MKKVIIIDGNSMAYSSLPNPDKFKDKFLYSSKDQRDIFIVRKFMKKFLRYKYLFYNDYHFIVVFDEQNKVTFRHMLDPKYKSKTLSAKRQEQKDYVYKQINDIKDILKKMNVPVYSSPDWEADDIIGMLVEKLEKRGKLSTIISGDKDILQLISDKTRVQFIAPDNTSLLTSRKNVWELSGGVWPDQVIDIKILAGDSSDNIKGLGVIKNGKVDYWTKEDAAAQIKKWSSIENMVNNINKVEEPFRKSLIKGKDKIEHNRKLVTIVRDWSIEEKFDYFIDEKINSKVINDIIEDLNLEELKKNNRIRKNLEA